MSPTLPIDIRHRALRGGRLHIRSGTANRRVRDRYKADLYELLEGGHLDLIERVRAGTLSLPEIRQALRDGDVNTLRPPEPGPEPEPIPPLPLGEALDRALSVVRAAGVDGTTRLYVSAANLLRERFGDDRDMASISSDEARGFLQVPRTWRGQDGEEAWSPGRQSVVRSLMGRVWKDEIDREAEMAARNGHPPRLTINVWRGLNLPRVRPTRFAFLRPEEWRALAGKVEGTPVAAVLALGCLAGLRQQEIAHLRPGVDVDLEERVIRIQARVGEFRWRPKTERGERRVPIGRQLRSILEAHAPFSGSRYLIVSEGRDRPLSHTTIINWTRDAFGEAGIRYGRTGDALTHHSLRHTFASWLVQRDVSPLKVAELIGDTPEMVMRVYGHLAPRDLIRTIELLDGIVEGKA